jgi:hypothetical protein
MSSWSVMVEGNYPPSSIFNYENNNITYSEVERFVRIILTEGVPFACVEFPMAFEFARGRAAERLGLHPKQLSLVGSARIGYSLAPKEFGRPFSLTKSDIDLFAVSERLFKLTVEEHRRFMHSWRHGDIRPLHEMQRQYWEDYEKKDPINIERGFLNGNHIPTLDQFPIAQQVGDAAYKFHVNLEARAGRKIGRKASIRIYKDWKSAVRQIAVTLYRNIDSIKRSKPVEHVGRVSEA